MLAINLRKRHWRAWITDEPAPPRVHQHHGADRGGSKEDVPKSGRTCSRHAHRSRLAYGHRRPQIVFRVDGAPYGTTRTDSAGVATLALKRAARSTWRSIDATFAGDDCYRPSTASG